MIELFTIFFILIQFISIIQRKGLIIDFNILQTSLRNDLGEILSDDNNTITVKSVMKKMFFISVFFYFFYFSYFFYVFLNELISKPIFIISVLSIFISLIFEVIFYKKMIKNSTFKANINKIVTILATINSILQIALIISITTNLFL